MKYALVAARGVAGIAACDVVPAEYTSQVTMFHVAPLSQGVIPLDMDTADAFGDLYFDWDTNHRLYKCKFEPDSNDCSNPEVAADDLVITRLVVELDNRWSNYHRCNICINGSDRHGTDDCTDGEYVCTCGPNDATRGTNRTADTCLNLYGKPTVGIENLANNHAKDDCDEDKADYYCWSEHVGAKFQGVWYSMPKDGFCGHNASELRDCTWRVMEVTKVVDKRCADHAMFSMLEEFETTEQNDENQCFSGCDDSGIGVVRNTSSTCWIKCLYEAVLGTNGGKGPLLWDVNDNNGIPTHRMVDLWNNLFHQQQDGGLCEDLNPEPGQGAKQEQSSVVPAEYRAELTMFHVAPRSAGAIPLDMDTADAFGDLYFDWDTNHFPYKCLSEPDSNDCSNPEVVSDELVITRLRVEVDNRWSAYHKCNICINGSDRHGAVNCTDGEYVCTCGPNDATSDQDITDKCKNAFGNPTVGFKNLAIEHAKDDCGEHDHDYYCWSEHIGDKFQGMWYSMPKEGYCGDEAVELTDDCTWRVLEVTKVVDKSCADAAMFSLLEDFEMNEQQDGHLCFQSCTDSGVGAERNTSSSCWIKCAYEAVLGTNGGRGPHLWSATQNDGIPTSRMVDLWNNLFLPSAEGGLCDDLQQKTIVV